MKDPDEKPVAKPRRPKALPLTDADRATEEGQRLQAELDTAYLEIDQLHSLYADALKEMREAQAEVDELKDELREMTLARHDEWQALKTELKAAKEEADRWRRAASRSARLDDLRK